MSQIVASWPYLSKDGEVLGVVKRFNKGDGGKDVVPYFVKNGPGDFSKGGGEKPWPLFNLPGIVNSKTIIVVEGEKCAAALVQLSIPVTTSRGGWQSAKEADWSVCSKAEKIYLLPDADWQGEGYIANVAKFISAVNPNAQFRICRVNFKEGGEDIVDWMQERCPEWDGYTELTTEQKELLRPQIKEFFQNSKAYNEGVLEETEIAAQSKTLKDHTADLKQALTFSSIFARYGKTDSKISEKPNGWNLTSSPFTSDSDPSFNFNEKEKRWRCYSSGQGGDIFGLIAALEGISTKGDDWRKVLEVAESITGKEKPKQEKKSNVTSILPRLPLDLHAIAPELLSIPNEGVSAIEAFDNCETLLRRIAGSDGTADEFIFDQIKLHFNLTTAMLKPFRKAVTTYRKELRETGRIERPSSREEKPEEAPPELYLELYPKFLEKIHLDIFSGDLVSWDEQAGFFVPVLNQMKGLKARFHRYGYENNIRFWMPNVDYYLEEYRKTLTPGLPLDIPEWDGFDYIKKATDRITLNPVTTGLTNYVIDQTVLEEIMKEWFSKLWEKFKDPTIQNPLIILQGPQNAGKDTWQANLLGGFGQYLVKVQKEDSIKDARGTLHTGVAVIVSEVDQLLRNKDDASLIKDMLTAARTNLRLPYEPRPCPRWVRCSFQGNCNPKEILKDPTGNRRFIIFEVQSIDWAEDGSKSLTSREQLQVIAQAKVLASQKYRASEQSRLAVGGYIASKTPETTEDAILKEWDSSAQELYESLSEENQELCIEAAAGTDYFGFMPNRLMNTPATESKPESRFLAILAGKDSYWSERKVSMVLSKAGRKSSVRLATDGKVHRGYFWENKTVTGATPSVGPATERGFFGDDDFMEQD